MYQTLQENKTEPTSLFRLPIPKHQSNRYNETSFFSFFAIVGFFLFSFLFFFRPPHLPVPLSQPKAKPALASTVFFLFSIPTPPSDKVTDLISHRHWPQASGDQVSFYLKT